jgi:hypothetical protein
MYCDGKYRNTPVVHGTEVFQLPPEPPVGSVVVPLPDIGGPFWTRDDEHPVQRWRQSKLNDHRRMTWGEVLVMAGGQVQLLP